MWYQNSKQPILAGKGTELIRRAKILKVANQKKN